MSKEAKYPIECTRKWIGNERVEIARILAQVRYDADFLLSHQNSEETENQKPNEAVDLEGSPLT